MRGLSEDLLLKLSADEGPPLFSTVALQDLSKRILSICRRNPLPLFQFILAGLTEKSLQNDSKEPRHPSVRSPSSHRHEAKSFL